MLQKRLFIIIMVSDACLEKLWLLSCYIFTVKLSATDAQFNNYFSSPAEFNQAQFVLYYSDGTGVSWTI